MGLAAAGWGQNPVSPESAPQFAAPAPAATSLSPASPAGRRYVVAKDDLLAIDVVGVQELSRDYRVDGDGMISVPMLSRPLDAAGLTLGQLASAVRQQLLDAGLVTDPQVTVSVKSSPWNSVVLSGAAKKPGVYPVYGHTTLLELLTEAEGLSDEAGSTAIVTRAQGSSPAAAPGAAADARPAASQTVKVDVWRLWRNGEASLNLELYPGDRVTVEKAGVVYVMGAVNRAGGFPLTNDEEHMTMLKAIALAGNLTHEAKPAQAVIIRKAPNAPSGRQEIRVNLKKVLSSRAADQPLVASDILYVPESGVRRTLDTVIPTAVSSSIYHVPF
jgi:polysaccharide export outer membrane protein